MKSTINKIALPILTFLFIFIGCTTDDAADNPLIMTKCNTSELLIIEKSEVTYPIESHWKLSTTLTLKCQDKFIDDAEVEVKFWSPFDKYRGITDDRGQINITLNGQGENPIGRNITVKVVGENDKMTKTFTID